jgi:hypothetical protein
MILREKLYLTWMYLLATEDNRSHNAARRTNNSLTTTLHKKWLIQTIHFFFSLSLFLFWNETELQYTIACLAFFILLEAKLNFSSDKIILLEKQNGWHKTFAKNSEFEKRENCFLLYCSRLRHDLAMFKKLDNLKLDYFTSSNFV